MPKPLMRGGDQFSRYLCTPADANASENNC